VVEVGLDQLKLGVSCAGAAVPIGSGITGETAGSVGGSGNGLGSAIGATGAGSGTGSGTGLAGIGSKVAGVERGSV
jgi:hypothetical protein